MKQTEFDSTKAEFSLSLNDNIIILRYFTIRSYNKYAKNSVEWYEMVKYIKDVLEHDLKMKTLIYMMDNSEAISTNPSILETSNTDDPEIFNIVIKINDEVISHRIFDGKIYPPKVRYTVDIKNRVKDFIKDMCDVLSSQDLTHTYLGYDLKSI